MELILEVPFIFGYILGFTGRQDPDTLVKWYLHGAFQPFMRAHGHETVKRREPWV